MNDLIKRLKRKVYRLIRDKFPGSAAYWEDRYRAGRNSGSGSYNRLAEYKATVLNEFVEKNRIATVIEFGCGDGNQLSLAKYPEYVGLDVSRTAIQICIKKFEGDSSKGFLLYDSTAFKDPNHLITADLSLSLDVLYHLVEDEIFHLYMTHLFSAARRYVIVYSSNHDGRIANHVRDRNFTTWIEIHMPNWKLISKLENPYKFDPKDMDNTSRADFFIFSNANTVSL